MLRLSIIVPFYNVAKFLSKCVESLLKQDFSGEEYEIIVINDGSTDGSDLIAIKYANEYRNVYLINQQNKGAGGARNTGIQYSGGKYIQFVDADDFLCFNRIRTLLDKMDRDELDILRFNYQHVNEHYEVVQPHKNPGQFVDYRDEVTDGISFLTQRLGYACYVPQFIFRSDLIRKEKNLFKEQIYFEDTEWIPRILIQAKRITSVNTIVYNYLLNEESITQGMDDEKKRKILNDKLSIVDSMKIQMADMKDKRWHKGMIAFTVLSALDDAIAYFWNEYADVIAKIKQKEVFPLYSYQLNQKKKISLHVLNFSPAVYGFVRHAYFAIKS